MRTITLEEHFASPGFVEGPGSSLKEYAKNPDHPLSKVLPALSNLGAERIAAMDAASVDVQVLSLTAPGVEQLDPAESVALAREANDFLGEAVRCYPKRFVGLAALPSATPSAAVSELERTVRQYGFKGAVINGHIKGRYLDDQFFWPILECADALKIPIQLHPTPPPKAVIEASYGGFPPMIKGMMAGAGWGWHIETATHVLRIILGGVFDRFPNLQFLIGHLGETLPFMLPRFDAQFTPVRTKLKRPISEYLRENVHYSFSGFNYLPSFLNLLLHIGVDRIMFSIDHPYQSMAKAHEFLNQLPVSATDKERIAHGNAERLLGI